MNLDSLKGVKATIEYNGKTRFVFNKRGKQVGVSDDSLIKNTLQNLKNYPALQVYTNATDEQMQLIDKATIHQLSAFQNQKVVAAETKKVAKTSKSKS